MVAFDGSPEAQLALRTAHQLAARTGATLRALTVIEPLAAAQGDFVPFPLLGTGMPVDHLPPLHELRQGEALSRRQCAARDSLAAAVQGLGGDAEVEQVVVAGDPVSVILDAAGDGGQLLVLGSRGYVLGSRGYGPVRRSLVGSVSIEVLRRAPCPVLVTPRVAEHDA